MKSKLTIKLDLLPAEKNKLRANKIRVSDISEYTAEELFYLLHVPMIRAMEILALVEFQKVPSIGIKFAQDLILLGYYSLEDVKELDGAKLIDELEQLTDRWIDPCVEDQCRLVVYYANTRDNLKRWWHFTEERKQYRLQHGYPANRPKKAWFE